MRSKNSRTATASLSVLACALCKFVAVDAKDKVHVARSAVTSRSASPRTVTVRSAAFMRTSPSPRTNPPMIRPAEIMPALAIQRLKVASPRLCVALGATVSGSSDIIPFLSGQSGGAQSKLCSVNRALI